MPIFVAVVGSRNSGKSTIIKSLTGCSNNSFRGSVTDTVSKTSVQVIANSPQESTMTLQQLQGHLQTASRPSFNGIVCALQPTKPNRRLSMEDVLKEVIKQKFTIHVFLLDPPRQGTAPAASDVSSRLSTLGLKCVALDARRFAHLNAVDINKRSNIIH